MQPPGGVQPGGLLLRGMEMRKAIVDSSNTAARKLTHRASCRVPTDRVDTSSAASDPASTPASSLRRPIGGMYFAAAVRLSPHCSNCAERPVPVQRLPQNHRLRRRSPEV